MSKGGIESKKGAEQESRDKPANPSSDELLQALLDRYDSGNQGKTFISEDLSDEIKGHPDFIRLHGKRTILEIPSAEKSTSQLLQDDESHSSEEHISATDIVVINEMRRKSPKK